MLENKGGDVKITSSIDGRDGLCYVLPLITLYDNRDDNVDQISGITISNRVRRWTSNKKGVRVGSDINNVQRTDHPTGF